MSTDGEHAPEYEENKLSDADKASVKHEDRYDALSRHALLRIIKVPDR